MMKKLLYVTCIMCLYGLSAIQGFAQTADDLKKKIDERNEQIKQLETQIQKYNEEVSIVGKEAKTLQTTLKTLNLTEKKLKTDLTLTDKKISKTELTIDEISDEITKTSNHISTNKDAITKLLQNTRNADNVSLFETFLSGVSFSDTWNEVDTTQRFQAEMRQKSDELRSLNKNFEIQKGSLLGQKNKLVGLKQDLAGKKQVVELTKQEKAGLLKQTKNKEQAFQQLIKTTEDQKEQFEKELFEFESQLKLQIDPRGYPSPLNGILSWPLDKIIITQTFGRTVAAQKLYVSGSHNGVDFGVSQGTRVKNVLSGTVVGTGNTDAYSGCHSFGKWVMVKHPNGLSTIYAHLSVISASKGDELKTGDLIGFSGNTGYSTGPHLHISVYATQGVRIEKFANSRGCKEAVLPLADIKAYLDPMQYFPKR